MLVIVSKMFPTNTQSWLEFDKKKYFLWGVGTQPYNELTENTCCIMLHC